MEKVLILKVHTVYFMMIKDQRYCVCFPPKAFIYTRKLLIDVKRPIMMFYNEVLYFVV